MGVRTPAEARTLADSIRRAAASSLDPVELGIAQDNLGSNQPSPGFDIRVDIAQAELGTVLFAQGTVPFERGTVLFVDYFEQVPDLGQRVPSQGWFAVVLAAFLVGNSRHKDCYTPAH